MPNQEKDMNAVETKDDIAGMERAVEDAAASETSTVPEQDAAGQQAADRTGAAAETVSRAEFDQLKAERDQLVDRLARLQAEFENARKRAERVAAQSLSAR